MYLSHQLFQRFLFGFVFCEERIQRPLKLFFFFFLRNFHLLGFYIDYSSWTINRNVTVISILVSLKL